MDIATISLILQLLILAMLIYGYFLFKTGDIKGHGFVLCTATAVHIGVIILRMIPAASSDPQFMSISFDPLSLIHWGHAALGLLAPALGSYISLRWVWHGTDPRFCRGKWLMRITFVSWMVALISGIVMYFLP
jgi:uncharacterized membrane protein YozB (DUF420 family)